MFALLFRVPVCAGGWPLARGAVSGFAKTAPRAIVQPFIHSVDFAIMQHHRGTLSGCFCVCPFAQTAGRSPRGGLRLRQNLPVGYRPAFYSFGEFRYHGTTPRNICGLLLRVA